LHGYAYLKTTEASFLSHSVAPMVLTAGWARQSVPLTAYAIQLLLNFMWTPLFFKLHKLELATFDILGRCIKL
jgi:tryptophan-rich sensory protein